MTTPGKDRITIFFYKYAKIGNPEILRNHLYYEWEKLGVLGKFMLPMKELTRNYLFLHKI